MDNLPEKRQETVPGIGMSGIVMCPFFKGPCLKSGCELWVELTYSSGKPSERKVARCSLAWMTLLSTEIRASIDKINKEEINAKTVA